MSRVIKDIQDKNTGELIYPRTHAKAIVTEGNNTLNDLLESNVIDKVTTLYNVTQVTYSQLKELVDNSLLIPGHRYAITDYTCIYILPVSLEEMEIECPDVLYIVCSAISNNVLSEDVLYIRQEGYVEIAECKYSINPEKCSWTRNMSSKTPKGVVYYMRDVHNNICPYDFKHVKFRRWAISDITPCTIPDDGATYPCSPYKAYMTDSAKKWADDRKRIGSGSYDDAVLIEGIYSGKWINTTQECKNFFGSTDDTPIEFTDKHVLTNVKPYQNTEHPRNKYLAWLPNMHDSGGFESITSTYKIHHLANVSTIPEDYIDVYTFDINGEDLSELIMASGNPRIYSVSIAKGGMVQNDIMVLPNTTFMVTTSLSSVLSATTQIMRNISISNAFNNTMLLHPTLKYSFAQGIETKLETFQRNIFILTALNRCNLMGTVSGNIVVGKLTNFNTRLEFKDCVLFGDYETVEIGGKTSALLWYGTYGVNLDSSPSTITTKDGTWTYEVETEGSFYSNIMGPMQYCHVSAHFNTNTFRAPYIKGLIVEGANQGSSYGECKWGTKLCYGAGSFLRYGNLTSGTTLNTYSFAVSGGLTTNGIYKVDSYQQPDMINTKVYAYYGLGLKLQDLTEDEKAMLSSSRATELIWNGGSSDLNGKWEIRYLRASLTEAPSDDNYYVRRNDGWQALSVVSEEENGLMSSELLALLLSVNDSITSTGDSITALEGFVTKYKTRLTKTSVANIPTTNRFVFVTISANGSFSLSGRNQPEVHVIIKNSSTSSITVALPTSSSYIMVDGKTSLTIPASGYVEVNAVLNNTVWYLRSC